MAKTKTILAVLMVLLIVFASGCGLIEKKPDAIQKQNVAKIGNQYITRAQLDVLFAYAKSVLAEQPGYDENSQDTKNYLAQSKRDLLDQMVSQNILEQKALELKIFKDENDIKDQAQKLIDTEYKAGKSEDDYNKWMTDSKLNPELVDIKARYEIVYDKMYEYMTKDVTVTDDEAKKQYDSNQLQYTEQPDSMEVSHILVAADKQELAKEIRQKLVDGADFKALSDQYSTDDAAKANGGSLGEILYTDTNYDATFMTAAMALKVGEISQPVQTQFGWHIIKVTKKNEYPLIPFDKVKDEIKSQLLTQDKNTKFSDTLTQWKNQIGVETYDGNIDNTK